MARPRLHHRCSVEGCEKPGPFARGWCSMHYQRWRKWGDPNKVILNKHVVRHGTRNEYQNFGCRCDLCREAAVAHMRETMKAYCVDCGTQIWGGVPSRVGTRCRPCSVAHRTRPLDDFHGTETGYSKGCRCRECRGAAAAARRRRRAANPEHQRAYDRARKRKRYWEGLSPLQKATSALRDDGSRR